MTRQGLQILLERVARRGPGRVDAIGREHRKQIFWLGVYRLSNDERTAVRRGLPEMRARKLASDDAVAALIRRYRG
jgi:hypothetical protein